MTASRPIPKIPPMTGKVMKCSVEFDIALILRQLALARSPTFSAITFSAGRVAKRPVYQSELDHRRRCERRFVATLVRGNQYVLRSRQNVTVATRELVCYPAGNLGLHRINRARFRESELCTANPLFTFYMVFLTADFKGNDGSSMQF